MTDINREEVHARLAASEARVATTVTDMRADLKTGLSEIRTDMEKMRGSMETMRADIHQMFSAQTKWTVLIVFGALATAGTIWAFLKPWDPMPSTPSVPLVIYAQPFSCSGAPCGRVGQSAQEGISSIDMTLDAMSEKLSGSS